MELKELELTDSLVRVALIGSLDHLNAGKIDAKLMACTVARDIDTIVDMSQVSFISSLGMAMFVNCYKGLKRRQKTLVLLTPQPEVFGALEMARLTTMFAIAQDEAEAQRILSKA